MGSRVKFLIAFCLLAGMVKGQQLQQSLEIDGLSIQYHTYKGRLDGYYKSTYANGVKRAEGYLKNNLRIGEWTVYDSLSNILHCRLYETPYSYKRVYPPLPRIPLIQLLSENVIETSKGEKGIWHYPYMYHSDYARTTRIWRDIVKKDNGILFKNGILAQTLKAGIKEGSIDEIFEDENFKKHVDSINYTDFDRVVAYKIKEDWAYSIPNQEMRPYLIGICPIIKTADSIPKLKELFWIWYPDCRETLSKVSVMDRNEQLSLDDVCFERRFNSTVYAKNELGEKALKISKNEQVKASRILEIKQLEEEHELWINGPVRNP